MQRRDILKTSGLLFGSLLLGGLPSALEAKPDKIIKPTQQNPLILDSNENSLGMSPKAKEAILEEIPNAFRYLRYDEHTIWMDLIETLGTNFNLKKENIILGNGSSGTIHSTIQALAAKATQAKIPIQLIVPELTFELAQYYAKPLNIPIVKVALDDEMNFDLKKMHQSADNFKGLSIVYICNPNNPTGTITPSTKLDKWIEKAPSNTFFMIDEAYGEFVQDPEFKSATNWIKKGKKNLIVIKTFSKIYALAGLRIGYGIAMKDTIDHINQFAEVDNINSLAAAAALASLKDKVFFQKSFKSNQIARKMLENTLNELKIKYLPSQANFLFYQIKGDLKTYQKRMKDSHILVGREFPPYLNWNRISLGTPDEMEIFTATLKSFRKKGWI
ncbi:aminotransferase class I [Helicobacter sp. 13S00477-4]|nr:aminotransferase class I [Helicobacter sp. 13S00477-4]